MLLPWREALERLDGHTLHYEAPPPQSGVIITNSNPERSITISEEVWFKCIGDQLAMTEYDGFCGADNGKIDARVAKRIIEAIKRYGVKID
jgi:hypothetical protein